MNSISTYANVIEITIDCNKRHEIIESYISGTYEIINHDRKHWLGVPRDVAQQLQGNINNWYSYGRSQGRSSLLRIYYHDGTYCAGIDPYMIIESKKEKSKLLLLIK